MTKIKIDGKTISIEDGLDDYILDRLESVGAKKIESQEVQKSLAFKEFVDPVTIGILIGGGVAWIAYRVTQQQKETFRKGFSKGLGRI